MRQVESELDRYLNLLRIEIRRRGYTQLEIQRTLGWGRSYISQLVTKQKSLRVEHVLLILKVIDLEPGEFFGKLYESPVPGGAFGPAWAAAPGPAWAAPGPAGDLLREVQELKGQFQGLVALLMEKGTIGGEELMAAVQSERQRA